MSDSWLVVAAIAAGILLLAFVLVRVVRWVRARRDWVLPPEGTLEARLQAFAPPPTTAEKLAELPAEEPAETPVPPAATTPQAVATSPVAVVLPSEASGTPEVTEPTPELPTEVAPRRHKSVEVVADGVVIGVVEGSESHRRFRAAADELLGDLKEARDASR